MDDIFSRGPDTGEESGLPPFFPLPFPSIAVGAVDLRLLLPQRLIFAEAFPSFLISHEERLTSECSYPKESGSFPPL